jgi:hypothetical protein
VRRRAAHGHPASRPMAPRCPPADRVSTGPSEGEGPIRT